MVTLKSLNSKTNYSEVLCIPLIDLELAKEFIQNVHLILKEKNSQELSSIVQYLSNKLKSIVNKSTVDFEIQLLTLEEVSEGIISGEIWTDNSTILSLLELGVQIYSQNLQNEFQLTNHFSLTSFDLKSDSKLMESKIEIISQEFFDNSENENYLEEICDLIMNANDYCALAFSSDENLISIVKQNIKMSHIKGLFIEVIW